MNHAAQIGGILASALLACGPALAQKKPPAPATPGPLLVIDSAGNVAGRFAGTFINGPDSVQMAAITVNGALTMAPIGFLQLADGTQSRGFGWIPSLRSPIYYSTYNCTGTPLVVVTGATQAYLGVRASVVDLVGSSRVLYLGTNDAPTSQIAGSQRSWNYYSSPEFSYSSCSGLGFGVPAVPLETTVVLDVLYPHPLTLR